MRTGVVFWVISGHVGGCARFQANQKVQICANFLKFFASEEIKVICFRQRSSLSSQLWGNQKKLKNVFSLTFDVNGTFLWLQESTAMSIFFHPRCLPAECFNSLDHNEITQRVLHLFCIQFGWVGCFFIFRSTVRCCSTQSASRESIRIVLELFSRKWKSCVFFAGLMLSSSRYALPNIRWLEKTELFLASESFHLLRCCSWSMVEVKWMSRARIKSEKTEQPKWNRGKLFSLDWIALRRCRHARGPLGSVHCCHTNDCKPRVWMMMSEEGKQKLNFFIVFCLLFPRTREWT